MSTGALYTLIVNTGAQDKLLLATELLHKRLIEIRNMRVKHPNIKDPTPTLTDIERTHILFLNQHYKPFVACAYEYQAILPQEGLLKFGSRLTFSIPQFGDFFADMMIHIRLQGLATTVAGNQVRYCNFLGHRILRSCEWEVNYNKLDNYDSDLYNFHYQFFVHPRKRVAWQRCAAQEVPTIAYLTNNPGVDEYREVKYIVDGPQTPKIAHNIVDVWMPLLFWFNKDPRLAIPSLSVPYGQRFIRITLADIEEIASGTIVPAGFTIPTIERVELFINNIFINPDILDIFIKRISFSLIRIHKFQHNNISDANAEIRLDQLKFPAETFYIGARPNVNLLTMDRWNLFHVVTDRLIPYPVAIPNPIPPPNFILAFSSAINQIAVPTLSSIRFRTHGVDIYRQFPSEFFNFYIPYTYGERINSPDDIGMLMATLNIYPGAYQPSGYINLSRTREFFIDYTSDVISPIFPCDLLVIAITINFVLVAEGSMALRYSV